MIDKIKNELKTAMIAKNKNRVDTLRNILSNLKIGEINKKQPLTDNESLRVLQTMAKQIKDSIKQFKEGHREDLIAKEKAELEILIEFLPESMSVDEIKKIIDKVIEKIGASTIKDMGKVMGAVISMTNGRADNKIISKMVKERLD